MYRQSRREFTKWDIWYAVISIILGMMDFIFFIVGITSHAFYEIISFVFTAILAIFLYLFFKGKLPQKKTVDYSMLAKKEIFHCLRENTGNTYTTEVFLNKLDEIIKDSTLKKYLKKNSETILNKMVSEKHIQMTQKNGQIHYFYP